MAKSIVVERDELPHFTSHGGIPQAVVVVNEPRLVVEPEEGEPFTIILKGPMLW